MPIPSRLKPTSESLVLDTHSRKAWLRAQPCLYIQLHVRLPSLRAVLVRIKLTSIPPLPHPHLEHSLRQLSSGETGHYAVIIRLHVPQLRLTSPLIVGTSRVGVSLFVPLRDHGVDLKVCVWGGRDKGRVEGGVGGHTGAYVRHCTTLTL